MAPEPTDEQLQRAWRELAHDDWAPVAELRVDYRRYLLIRARAIALANRRTPEPPAPPPPVAPPPPASWGSLRVPHAEPILDNKRRASGERDDD